MSPCAVVGEQEIFITFGEALAVTGLLLGLGAAVALLANTPLNRNTATVMAVNFLVDSMG